MKTSRILLFAIIALFAVACAPTVTETVATVTSDDSETAETVTEDSEMSDTDMEESDEAMDDMEATEEAMDDMESDEHMDDDMDSDMEATEEAMDDMDDSDSDMEESDDAMDDDESSDAGTDATVQTVSYNGPEWANLTLTNARTNETFTLADFAGKVVMVEPMATWCSNCRAQQRQVREAIPNVDADQVVFISLSVENNFANARLAEYADDNGFDWVFVVGTPELLSALTNEYGRTVTNPPAVPRFSITADGTISGLSTGAHSATQILNEVNELLGS